MNAPKFFALALVVSASACSKKVEVTTEPAPVAEPAPEPEPEPAPEPVEDPSDVHIVGDHLEIDQKILFASNSDEILGESSTIIEHLAQTLKNHGEFTKLHVVGHTDSTGDDAHNQDLSERRANAVVKALADLGVTQTMDGRGAGETEPTCSEETDECHDKNRRVEFVVEK